MKKILIVKITSMGDLIQFFPALTDAARAIPGIQFDWLVEESFKDIPSLHPSINQLITLPYRKWKKNLKHEGINWSEVKTFWRALRSQRYDMVIDAQSNIKSAFVTRLARGKKYGLDKASVREYGAHWAYSKRISISRSQNHTERMRLILSTLLAYPMPESQADYGIIKENLPALDIQLPEKFIFINHLCSSNIRLWPEAYWSQVIDELLAKGFEIVLPWWSDEEKARSYRLKNNNPRVHTIPPLNLPEKAAVLAKATAAISVDTGLAHMAASLNVPNIVLYGPTTAEFTGTVGQKQVHLTASGLPCIPCLRTDCHYQGPSEYNLPCMELIKPQQVLQAFESLIA